MAKVTLRRVVALDRKTDRGVNSLDLEVPDGQFLVLTGPPGSGKSSVLRMIAGLEDISSGEVSIDERRVNELAPKDRDVTMVFAKDSLYPQMTVRQNISFGLRRRRFGAAEIRKRTEEAASILSVEELLEVTPGRLSFAERQRVAIARALVRQPKVLLFDDALTHVDGESRAKLRKDIVMLHERVRSTTIFATEDNREAMSMGEIIAVLDRGALQATGTPRHLYEEPENIFVAGFLGRPPMNFIRGELKLDRGSLRFYEAESGTIEIDLSVHERFDVMVSFVTKFVVLGVRPEGIDLAVSRSRERDPLASFRAVAELVAPFGGGTDIYFHTGAHSGICRSAKWVDRNEAGRRMEFLVNLKIIHFFDPISGKRIV